MRPLTRSPGSDWVVEKVLTCVEQVPPGRVITYGQVGEITGVGPRQVGAVLATYGSGVCWWRVTNSVGELPERHHRAAAQHWALEGITWKANRKGCRINAHRADLAAVAAAYDREIATRER